MTNSRDGVVCSHVFISYRVASDRQLARRLYDLLIHINLEDTGQKLRVYLDQTRLEDGQRWDSGFMEGLANASVFVPIVSVGSVGPMCQLGGDKGGTAAGQPLACSTPSCPTPRSSCRQSVRTCSSGSQSTGS